jgi:hypothetical protein
LVIVNSRRIASPIVSARVLRPNIRPNLAGANVAVVIAGSRCAEIRKNGLLLNLAFAQGGEIVGDGFLFVEADLAGIGAYETLIEDAAGKLVEVFVFEGAQHARADLGGIGDGVERDAALLALFAKFISKRSQGWLRRTGFPLRMMGLMIGEGEGGRQND